MSDYLSDVKLHRTVGFDTHDSNVLLTELGRDLLGMKKLKSALNVSFTTSHVGPFLIEESIEHKLYEGLNDVTQIIK